MSDTTTTEWTIERVLEVRVRAARARADKRRALLAEAAIEVPWVIEQTSDFPSLYGPKRDEVAAAFEQAQEAWTVAVSALALAEQEVQAQQGKAEPVPWDMASHWEIKRFAAILWEDGEDLEPADALKLARQAEQVRSQHHYETYIAPQYADEDPDEV